MFQLAFPAALLRDQQRAPQFVPLLQLPPKIETERGYIRCAGSVFPLFLRSPFIWYAGAYPPRPLTRRT